MELHLTWTQRVFLALIALPIVVLAILLGSSHRAGASENHQKTETVVEVTNQSTENSETKGVEESKIQDETRKDSTSVQVSEHQSTTTDSSTEKVNEESHSGIDSTCVGKYSVSECAWAATYSDTSLTANARQEKVNQLVDSYKADKVEETPVKADDHQSTTTDSTEKVSEENMTKVVPVSTETKVKVDDHQSTTADVKASPSTTEAIPTAQPTPVAPTPQGTITADSVVATTTPAPTTETVKLRDDKIPAPHSDVCDVTMSGDQWSTWGTTNSVSFGVTDACTTPLGLALTSNKVTVPKDDSRFFSPEFAQPLSAYYLGHFGPGVYTVPLKQTGVTGNECQWDIDILRNGSPANRTNTFNGCLPPLVPLPPAVQPPTTTTVTTTTTPPQTPTTTTTTTTVTTTNELPRTGGHRTIYGVSMSTIAWITCFVMFLAFWMTPTGRRTYAWFRADTGYRNRD